MTTNATIRPATADDRETLSQFPLAEHVDQTLADAAAGNALYAVAEVDGAVVGAATLDLVHEVNPQITRIWVVKEARRGGVGSTLSRWLEDQARERGHDAVFMMIDPNNERAIPMAIDLGYSATGDHYFVGTPDPFQVDDPADASEYYSIWRKSLTMS